MRITFTRNYVYYPFKIAFLVHEKFEDQTKHYTKDPHTSPNGVEGRYGSRDDSRDDMETVMY